MIKIKIVHSLIDTKEEIMSECREFSSNEESIRYLETIEKNKMQIIFDHLKLGKYTKGKLIRDTDYYLPETKNLYWRVSDANNIKTVVNIETV